MNQCATNTLAKVAQDDANGERVSSRRRAGEQTLNTAAKLTREQFSCGFKGGRGGRRMQRRPPRLHLHLFGEQKANLHNYGTLSASRRPYLHLCIRISGAGGSTTPHPPLRPRPLHRLPVLRHLSRRRRSLPDSLLFPHLPRPPRLPFFLLIF